MRFMEEIQASPEIAEQLVAWEIDDDAFTSYMSEFVDAALREMMRKRPSTEALRLCMLTCVWTGFELGYKASLELETRRQLEKS